MPEDRTTNSPNDPEPELSAVVFTVTFDPFVGGAEIALKEIASRLPSCRFDLITLRFDSAIPDYEVMGNIRIHRVGFSRPIRSISDTYRLPLSLNKYLFPFFACRKALALHRRQRYDFTWSIMANYAGFAALFFKMIRPSVPFLLTLQEGDSEEHILHRVGVFRPLFRRIFSSADKVQAISHFLASFARRMGYRADPIVVPNGVDTAVFTKTYTPGEQEELRRHLNQNMRLAEESGPGHVERESYVVTASRLVKKNGIASLIAAMRFLPKDVKLIILGDGPELVNLRSLVAQYGLDSRIVFVGAVEQGDIPKYFSISSVFARPSLSEGFGNSFVEAMAAGLPVVATPVGGIVDFVFDPDRNPKVEPTGLLAEPGNPESIAKKIGLLLNDEELRQKLIENGRKIALGYDWNKIAARMKAEVFDTLA